MADAMELVSKLRPIKSEGIVTPGEAVFAVIETAVCAAAPHASSQTAASANLPASEITDSPAPANSVARRIQPTLRRPGSIQPQQIAPRTYSAAVR